MDKDKEFDKWAKHEWRSLSPYGQRVARKAWLAAWELAPERTAELVAGSIRVVVETDCFDPLIRCVRADGPVVVTVRPAGGTPDQVWGGGGLPVEPLGVVGGEARFEVAEADG